MARKRVIKDALRRNNSVCEDEDRFKEILHIHCREPNEADSAKAILHNSGTTRRRRISTRGG